MPNILVSGAFGLHNLGDDAILESMVDNWRSRLGVDHIVAVSYDPLHTQASGIDAIPAHDFWAFIRVLLRSSVFVAGGGGILHELKSPKALLLLLARVIAARALGKPVMLYSIGVGPFRSRFGTWLARQIANLSTIVSVRDRESAQTLKRLGYNKICFEAADPVFLMKTQSEDVEYAESRLKSLCGPLSGGPLVVVVPRFWYHHVSLWANGTSLQQSLLQKLSEITDWLVSQYDAHVLFMPMQYPQDVVVCERIIEMLQYRQQVAILRQEPTPRQALAIIKQSALVVAMRLHALIFAHLCGTPFVALSYDSKVANLCTELNVSACFDLDSFQPDTIKSAILSNASHWFSSTPAKSSRSLDELEQKASIPLELLAGILRGSY